MGLVGEEDWAMTTCFNFPPAQVDAYPERTEIKVLNPKPKSRSLPLWVAALRAPLCLSVASCYRACLPPFRRLAQTARAAWPVARELVFVCVLCCCVLATCADQCSWCSWCSIRPVVPVLLTCVYECSSSSRRPVVRALAAVCPVVRVLVQWSALRGESG